MSPIFLLGFSWNKLFWIFPLDHAEIRPKSYLRRKARPSATSPQQFLLQHYSQGRRTKCIVGSDKEKQRWSLVTPNDKLLLAPPIIFCATVDAKVTESMSAIQRISLQEARWNHVPCDARIPSPVDHVSRDFRVTFVMCACYSPWTRVGLEVITLVLLLRSRTRWPCCRPTNRDFPWPCKSKTSEMMMKSYSLWRKKSLMQFTRQVRAASAARVPVNTKRPSLQLLSSIDMKTRDFYRWTKFGFQEVSVKDE